MYRLKKLAFVVQPNRLQGLIWQALLRSQSFAVILEAPNTDLIDCISQISAAGLPLPDLIILDAEIPGLNPYGFSRWCQKHCPGIRIFLTRMSAQPLLETERRWAQKQGAVNFFNGFRRDTLMSSAVAYIKEILTAVDAPFLDESTLLIVLLNIRRQTASTCPGAHNPPPTSRIPYNAKDQTVTSPDRVSQDKPSAAENAPNDIDWVASGLRTLNAGTVKPVAKSDSIFVPPFPLAERVR